MTDLIKIIILFIIWQLSIKSNLGYRYSKMNLIFMFLLILVGLAL